MIRKKDVLSLVGMEGNYSLIINVFLFNLVLRGICSYDNLTLREKKSLNRILNGENTRFYYSLKLKMIVGKSHGGKK